MSESTKDELSAGWRAQGAGVLSVDGKYWPVWLIHAHDGAVAFGATADALDAEELVLHAPDENDGAYHALLYNWAAAPGADEDRWHAYHAGRDAAAIVRAQVETLRTPGGVFDGPEVASGNALARVEASLLRSINADKDKLAEAVEAIGGVLPESPVAVGIDQFGLDVRGSAGVGRISFTEPVDGAGAERAVARFLEGKPV